MAGPNYTIAQTRARVAALEICWHYLEEQMPPDEADAKQYRDIQLKLQHEILALKEKAQRVRRPRSPRHRPL